MTTQLPSLTQFLDLTASKPQWPKARVAFQSHAPFRNIPLPLPFQLYMDWDIDESKQMAINLGKEALDLLGVLGEERPESAEQKRIIQNVTYERQLPAVQQATDSNNTPENFFVRVHRSNVTKTFKVSKSETLQQVIDNSLSKLAIFNDILPANATSEQFVMALLGEDLFLCSLEQQIGTVPRIQEKLAKGEKIISLQLLDRELAYIDSLSSIEFAQLPSSTISVFQFEKDHPSLKKYRIKVGEVISHIKRHQVASIDIKVFLRFRDTILNNSVKHSQITSYDGSCTVFDEWIELDVPLSIIPRETECVFIILINDSQIEVSTPVYDALGALRTGATTLLVYNLFEQIREIVYDRDKNGESTMTIEFPDWDAQCVVFAPEEISSQAHLQEQAKISPDAVKNESGILPGLMELLHTQTDVFSVHLVQESIFKMLGGSGSNANNTYNPIAVSIQLLSAECTDVRVRTAATKALHSLSDNELNIFLSILLYALQFELYDDNALMRFLLHRCMQNPTVTGAKTFWAAHHLAMTLPESSRYTLLLHELAQNLPRLFVRDTILPSILLIVQLEEALTQKSTQEQRAILDNLYIPQTQLGFSLPVARTTRISKVDKVSIVSDKKLLLTCTDTNSHATVSAYYDATEDLSQQAFILELMRLMNTMWKQHDLDMRMIHLLCDVCCLNDCTAMLEQVRETPLVCVHDLPVNTNPKAIAEFLQKKGIEATFDFIHSAVGFLLAIYVLGVSERTLKKMHLTDKGHLLHTDFHALQFSQDARQSYLEEAKNTQQVFNIQLFNVLRGDLNSAEAQQFFSLVRRGFMTIREEWRIFDTCLRFASSVGVVSNAQPEQASSWVHQSLMLDKSDQEAGETFEQGIRVALHEAGMMQVSFEE